MRSEDPFHEAKQTLIGLGHEHSATNSLTAPSAFNTAHACDLALRALYSTATGSPFPYYRFKPHHQPIRLAESLGIMHFYTPQAQRFLRKLEGYALHEARYPDTQPYRQYTDAKSAGRAKELLGAAEVFVRETESISRDPVVVETVRKHAK